MEPASPRGRFIVFEGGEGCGKSTQARLLAERMDALLTRQPGGTDIGRRIRSMVLSGLDDGEEILTDRAEALLMAADRAQHVETVIEPALRSGRHVVCDRYIGSSIAYQGYGRGLDVDVIRSISGWASGGLWPDLTVLLEVSEETARERVGTARDRIEAAGADFHRRVLVGFSEQADDEEDWWVTIDGEGDPAHVHDLVVDAVAGMLGRDLFA